MAPKTTPRLSYFPAELATPVAFLSGGKKAGNTCLQVTIIILVLLIIGVFVGAMVYIYCFADQNNTIVAINKNNKDSQKKAVTFAAGAPLEEISSEHLLQLLKSDGSVELDDIVVAFVSPNCGHCNVMKPALHAAALKSNLPIKTATYINAKQTPMVAQAMQQLKISGMPTIVRIEPKKKTANEYKGRDRSEAALVQFAS
jgi:thiol-disulfide isomerase/thioredoxin